MEVYSSRKLRGFLLSAACGIGSMPWLLLGKCFPSEGLGQLVYDIQHLPIDIHLEAMACMREWLKYGAGPSSRHRLASLKHKPWDSQHNNSNNAVLGSNSVKISCVVMACG